jgi:ribokinase
MSRILVMGALHHDVVVDAPRLPRLDETLVGHAVDYRFGGKGGNQAVAAARLGAEVAMIGRVGQDAAGAAMLAELDRAGVERSGVQEVAGASGMSVAITDASGGYGAVIVSAANLLNDGRDALPERFGICLMQNEVPEAANLALAARLPGDVRLILNAAPARPIDPALLARCGLLVVNRVEAADMARMDDPADASCALAGLGPAAVIVTLGAEGLLLCEGGEVAHLPAHLVEVVTTHGAGDMFLGGLAAALAAGETLTHAARFGQAAAALAVSRPVAQRAGIGAELVRRFMG